MSADTIAIELPTDPRYIDVAVAAAEALASRAGLDKDDVAELRARVHAALGERLSHREGQRVVLRYDVGEGFLGVRVEEITGVTS
jgi:hypothetical protein